jgi:hypothetical protein
MDLNLNYNTQYEYLYSVRINQETQEINISLIVVYTPKKHQKN